MSLHPPLGEYRAIYLKPAPGDAEPRIHPVLIGGPDGWHVTRAGSSGVTIAKGEQRLFYPWSSIYSVSLK